MTVMADLVESEHGIIDKFIGDGIMAVFLPGDGDHNHALCAVRAAIRMQQELVAIKARWRATRPDVAHVEARIGIHTGEMVAGNIGSATRMDYTVIGDNVNVASRIESSGAGGEVHVSAATRALLPDSIDAVRLEPILVKNRTQPVQIFSIAIPVASPLARGSVVAQPVLDLD
jgi:adenylate cyclase